MKPFDVASECCNRVAAFLQSTGGPYATVAAKVEENILFALATGMHIYSFDGTGNLRYWVCYWRVKPEDVEGLKERVRPVDCVSGSVLYVVECGNRAGRQGMAEIVKRLRALAGGMQGVFWHRPGKGDKVCDFPSQRGGEYGQ